MKYIKKLKLLASKHWWLTVFFIFLSVNIFFNHKVYWSELLNDTSFNGAVTGEVYAVEWGSEQIYNKLASGESPFTPIKTLLYPFGVDTVGADVGLGFWFLFFRPWLSMHQSFVMFVILAFLLANMGMYLLLIHLETKRPIAVIIALAYGYMTFITVKLGQPSYVMHFLFPWFYFSLFTFLLNKSIFKKILAGIGIPFFFVMTLWSNMYYFIMLLISLTVFGVYVLLVHRNKILPFIRTNFIYILFSSVLLLVFLLPWLTALYETFIFTNPPITNGWGGAVEFSSDLLGYFIPSGYNKYYGSLIPRIFKDVAFAQGMYENFTYPGIIILLTYAGYFLYYRKKIPGKLKKAIQPFLIVSLVFWVLTLGPFLHIAGRWAPTLDDGIKVVFPLPYIILHYIPFLANIRVPGRIIVAFIFFAYIVVAYLLNYIVGKLSLRKRYIFFIFLFIIFIIDHQYNEGILITPYKFPYSIYQTIKKNPHDVTVLEIPFTVRDGFTYFGDNNAIYTIVGQSHYNKPVLGGYSGRLPHHVKNYYLENPLFGYIGRKIDVVGDQNPGYLHDDSDQWHSLNIASSQKTADFLNIKYIIFKNDVFNNKIIFPQLQKMGYKIVQKQAIYTLLMREPQKKEFLKADISNPISRLLLAQGWHPLEDNFRWVDRRSSVMFKLNKQRDMDLIFNIGSFYKDQPVTVYVNKRKITNVDVTTTLKTYKVSIDSDLFKTGINTVHFIFENEYQPVKVFPGSQDARRLGGKFTSIYLKDEAK
ncbi:hypothetical protein A3A93_02770 [Candidatus Roizmanbacteria bacterium RIFCSPLOWO2_01_FULL_38_12]|uniref:DUF6311 domain-containing protein n=1 Tax=Candidatus Roizmanbacteria bacterium RIFCSPLOWO2_01_FULL_38_12 TaxID=1802061 RepID=A0A1F7IUH5_9BACT|nr:MAG: hypothetical protein A2861_01845 [Candidatus Roizmanbacteria bacterium RIFCSPHIGHO2_01_FULL_38_15]OGK34337.1 MAG: hypothetical protein A3F59_04835 [Candidatus Roizmanbacteria bacterium RIFCSPHIGHO2_12_FULL_38_13]OGK47020.1 MAG: hypothetical protein A3A93_02770 [Candidatus Roizmanbacteria bacterium RIFCSPLOWO2_01_FULL_38_12]